MSTTETIKCDCGSVFQWSPGPYEDDFIDIYRPKRCQSCDDKLRAEREAKEAERAAEQELRRQEWIARNKVEIVERIETATPQLFRRTDTSHPKFNHAAWAILENYRFTGEVPWLGLVGMTGRCKSRMAYLIAAQELERMTDVILPSFRFVPSYEIGDAVNRQHGSDWDEKAKARDFLDRIREVDVLLIDDLGKGRLTPAVASELFALIDHRYSSLSRTIWTSNSSPEVIAAGLPEDMAGPFVGRINESSKIFTFK